MTAEYDENEDISILVSREDKYLEGPIGVTGHQGHPGDEEIKDGGVI